jgi:hypothetical protein
MNDVHELWSAEYTKTWTKLAGRPVPEGQGWFPDCLPQSNLYTKELVKHLADHAWTKAMAKAMMEETTKLGG